MVLDPVKEQVPVNPGFMEDHVNEDHDTVVLDIAIRKLQAVILKASDNRGNRDHGGGKARKHPTA